VLRSIAAGVGWDGDTVEFTIVDDEYITEINRQYRGLDKPTDVISFSYTDDAAPASPSDDVVGEVYVSYETLLNDAHEKGVTPEHLFLRIGVHGLLHVLGYDHGSNEAACRMEAEEKRLLLDHLNLAEVEELF
jgi:probable rRNA maturation factor